MITPPTIGTRTSVLSTTRGTRVIQNGLVTTNTQVSSTTIEQAANTLSFVRSCLIDSGPLIALFAVDDRHHARFDALVKEESVRGRGLRLLTTWPSIVEASYLLEIPQRFEMLKWIELGGVVVYPFEPAQHLGDMSRCMRRYSEAGKREIDLADASLYWLAVESGVTDIMTVDVTDFSRFRLPRGKAFTLL
jgi:predicted nucleic acid-binding protein